MYKKSLNNNRWKLWLGVWFLFFIVACSKQNDTRTVDTLNVAILPDQNEQQVRSKYKPLIEHFKSHAGINAKLFVPESYNQLLQWFDSKQVDLALFGGVTYVKAHLKNNAIPLVMRDVDGGFRSVIIVSASNPAKSLHDLKGGSLAFGSRLSTSGHYMPRYFFQKENIIPEAFFSQIKYSGAHDITAEWVRDGKVDVGVSNSGVVNEMFRDGRLKRNKVKIIWQSPNFADYVWAIQPDVSEKQKIRIRDSFLHMSHDEKDKLLLKILGANYYIPVVTSDFSKLQEITLKIKQRAILR